MTGEILALEGVCCAGKTTTLRNLAKKLKAGVIPELPEFGRNLFKPFNMGSEIIENGLTSVGIERVRINAAYQLSEYTPYVLLDRCFVSTIALAYGAIDLIGIEGYRKIIDSVLDALESNDLTAPDKALYIKVDGETVNKRNESRVPKLEPYWVNTARVDRQNYFYESLAELQGIYLIDGVASPENVLSACLASTLMSPRIDSAELKTSVKQFVNKIP